MLDNFSRGWSALYHDEPEELKQLIATGGLNVNQVDQHGYTWLHHVINENSLSGARILIRAGAKITNDAIQLAKRLHALEFVDLFMLEISAIEIPNDCNVECV